MNVPWRKRANGIRLLGISSPPCQRKVDRYAAKVMKKTVAAGYSSQNRLPPFSRNSQIKAKTEKKAEVKGTPPRISSTINQRTKPKAAALAAAIPFMTEASAVGREEMVEANSRIPLDRSIHKYGFTRPQNA